MTDDVRGPASAREARADAKAAKARSKAMRPWYRKKRFLLPIALVVLIVIISLSASSSQKKEEEAAAKTCVGKTYPDQQKTDVCADASNAVSVGGLTVSAQPFVTQDDTIGGKALCSDVAISNTSDKSQDYNVFDFKVQTPSGDVATTSVLNFAGTLHSGTLIKGATKTGKVCTDDKGEKGQYVFIYKPNAFESKRGVWLFDV